MLKFNTHNHIESNDWNILVQEIYKRPYNFQQQDGCKPRQLVLLTVPYEEPFDYKNDAVPEIVNHDEMGVSFKSWLERNPEQELNSPHYWERITPLALRLWWERNFYPDVEMIANDLYEKGIIGAGQYVIDIDW